MNDVTTVQQDQLSEQNERCQIMCATFSRQPHTYIVIYSRDPE